MTLFYNSERDTHIEQTEHRDVFPMTSHSMRIQHCSNCRERRQKAVVSGQRPLNSETKPEQSEEKQIDLLTFFIWLFR